MDPPRACARRRHAGPSAPDRSPGELLVAEKGRPCGVLTIAEADGQSGVAALRAAFYVFAHSLALGVRPPLSAQLKRLGRAPCGEKAPCTGAADWPTTGQRVAPGPMCGRLTPGKASASRSSRWLGTLRACAGRRCARACAPARSAGDLHVANSVGAGRRPNDR